MKHIRSSGSTARPADPLGCQSISDPLAADPLGADPLAPNTSDRDGLGSVDGNALSGCETSEEGKPFRNGNEGSRQGGARAPHTSGSPIVQMKKGKKKGSDSDKAGTYYTTREGGTGSFDWDYYDEEMESDDANKRESDGTNDEIVEDAPVHNESGSFADDADFDEWIMGERLGVGAHAHSHMGHESEGSSESSGDTGMRSGGIDPETGERRGVIHSDTETEGEAFVGGEVTADAGAYTSGLEANAGARASAYLGA
ncbi:MAG: hypothetical protein HN348_06720, partial [Proteobacteria bacterium]|nr:hypothetical protein [Pseudomonadota bacterium]